MTRSTHDRLLSRLARFLPLVLLLAGSGTAGAQEWRTDFSKHSVPMSEILSGGPPKDGIPAVDKPQFITIPAATWLAAREPVVVVEWNGVARAYPLQILMWHEIVNDVIGGRPIAVTYCPLCNTAMVFDRTVDGTVLDFGTTGRLRMSDLVMYDRQTESWWQQALGEAIVGTMTGTKLQRTPSLMVSFAEFRKNFPNGEVLSRNTGFRREYGVNPYQRYDRSGGGPLPGFFGRRPDPRLKPMERVLTASQGDDRIVVPFSRLERDKVILTTVGGEAAVLWWAPGTASALDDGEIASGRDVGAAAAFRRTLDGRLLSFTANPDGTFRDKETNSRWTLLGKAIEGPLTGKALTPLEHGSHLWFAVAAFFDQARLEPGP